MAGDGDTRGGPMSPTAYGWQIVKLLMLLEVLAIVWDGPV